MDRIEPIRPSLPPIDATRVRKVTDEQEHAARRQARERERQRRGRPPRERSDGREWSTDEQPQRPDEEQDGPPRIDVRA